MEKLWYYGTMVLCKKLWYYDENYGTIPKTMETCFHIFEVDIFIQFDVQK